MTVLNDNPPERPDCCQFESMAELYAEFENLTAATGGIIRSKCEHAIYIYEHHFFHLAAITRPPLVTLSMRVEKDEIKTTTVGFGPYVVGYGGSRARYLTSAFCSMYEPDEVWAENPIVTNAKWVYIKQFDPTMRYPYTVALIGDRPEEGGILVPVSSFPCKRGDLRKWRQGVCIHPKQERPPEGSRS